MGESIRTFIAVELAAPVRHVLAELQEQMRREPVARNVRWVAPDAIHLTLKFLGDVDREGIPALGDAVAIACEGIEPFTLTLSGTGAFPNLRRPNVLWVGLTGDVAAAAGLAERIDEECGRLGMARETRPFSPHLTLGRVKRDLRPADQTAVGDLIARAQPHTGGEIAVNQVGIVKSELRPSGSIYTRLHIVELQSRRT